jgi:hypothetical protein
MKALTANRFSQKSPVLFRINTRRNLLEEEDLEN